MEIQQVRSPSVNVFAMSVILWGFFLTHTQGLHNDDVFQMPHMPISTFKNFSASVLKVLNTFKWTAVSL
jgi:hypothetical protein